MHLVRDRLCFGIKQFCRILYGHFPCSGNINLTATKQNTAKLCAFFMVSLIARFMGPTWGPSGAARTQVGPILVPWTMQSGMYCLQRVPCAVIKAAPLNALRICLYYIYIYIHQTMCIEFYWICARFCWCVCCGGYFITLRPRQNGRHFCRPHFQMHFLE